MTHGDPSHHMLFNIVMDAVLRAVLDVVCGPQEAHHCMIWAAGEINLVFYTDGGSIAGQDHEWIKDALTLRVAMFCRMGLDTNLDNTKAMVCTP